jgi:peptidoglycan hydrolase CwlO-like protein
MKHLPVIALLLLVSCAPRKKVIVENNYDDSEIKTRLSDLEQRVMSLEISRSSMISSMDWQQSQLDSLFESNADLYNSMNNLSTSLSNLESLTNEEISDLQAQIDAMGAAIIENESSANSAIQGLSDTLSALTESNSQEHSAMQALIDSLQASVNNIYSDNSSQASSIVALQSSLSSAQTTINNLSSQIITLQNNVNITQVVDPCGDTPNKYDEVIFKMSNGTYVASFSDNANGLNTRFSVLPVGNYQTTDGTNCRFSVNANGTLTW